MLASYVRRELLRNPRRTLAALTGVVLGVGLFSAVLFFIDGSGASMTKRAIAPLALDAQRVLTSPLGGGLRLAERLSPAGPLRRGEAATVSLTLTNEGAVPVNEVVVADEPPVPLAYVAGSARLNGRPLRDVAGGSPLSQGLARSGLNIGTIPPGHTVRLEYTARARRALPAAGALPLRGEVSSRENVVPTPANAPRELTLEQLQARIARIPGVAAADRLAFVDLPPGSLRGGASVRGGVRVFAFDTRYQRHYPSIRLAAGSFRPGAAVLSAEAAHALAVRPGGAVRLRLPGRRRPLSLPVGGVADLSRAKPLFYSRKSSNLEDFLYVPNSVVVSPGVFRNTVLPALRAATAARGRPIADLPLLEVDVLVDRALLHSDPGTALAQTEAIARAVRRIAPGQDYLIDNISNTLRVAKDDAAVAKRMFLFLGLPGALLAAFLTAYAGSILASAQRREQANLRIRGAHRGHLLRLLAYRTLAIAGVGSLLGTGLGLLSVIVVLGGSSLFEAAPARLLASALAATVVGMAATGLALYVPGRRALSREINQDRGELAPARASAWRRARLDFALLAAVALAEVLAFRAGAFDAPAGSVYEGRAVSLPSHLLLAPLLAWIAGILLSVRAFEVVMSRLPVPRPPRFGPLVLGTLARSLRRRSTSLGGGVIAIGLVVAIGTGLALFAASYDAAKAADSRFVVGSDLRITPSALSTRPHPPSYASQLEVGGVAAATPVVFKLENSVLTGPYTQDREDLAAIDPASFKRVAALADGFFAGRTAGSALDALAADPRGVLLNARTADDLQIGEGDTVEVLFERGTRSQRLVKLHVLGLFDRFPGFPEGVNLVANLRYYAAATGIRRADFFLAKSAEAGPAGLERAATALRAGPGGRDRINIGTTATVLDKDQSSLTALNVRGLLQLDSFFTLLMAAAAIAMFVFGLMLQRRREYVTLRAQGMSTGELQVLVLGEAAPVAAYGLGAGMLVGTGVAALLVHVLRPLFVLDPSLTFSAADLATLAALTGAATLASAVTATAVLRRLAPMELLREA